MRVPTFCHPIGDNEPCTFGLQCNVMRYNKKKGYHVFGSIRYYKYINLLTTIITKNLHRCQI